MLPTITLLTAMSAVSALLAGQWHLAGALGLATALLGRLDASLDSEESRLTSRVRE